MLKHLLSNRSISSLYSFRSFGMAAKLNQDEVAGMRIDYKVSKIDDEVPSKDPFEWFNLWFKDATEHSGIEEPNAMNIATATKNGKVSARMVLLKGVTERGFRFFTNHGSQKGQQLIENPYAALTFYWEPLQRQIRINGHVEKLSEEESTKYFHSRPFGSQIGALVSAQTVVIPNREHLEQKRIELTNKYEGKVVPKPDYWVGFLLVPERFEFWNVVNQSLYQYDRVQFRRSQEDELITNTPFSKPGVNGGGYVVVPDSFEFWCGGSGRLHDRMRFRHLKDGETIDVNMTKSGENGWLYERLSP